MLAIIPARVGSKGLPGKNLKMLIDKPLIAYSIEAALRSKHVSKVIVSTDSEDIADVATKYGAIIPFLRPKYLATDNALAIDNYIFTIEMLGNGCNTQINEFAVLQPTSPLRTFNDIDNAIDLFWAKNADSVISYTKEDHPIKWHKFINSDLSFKNIFDDGLTNRQDYKQSYYPNGAIFIFKTKLIKKRKYYSENSFAYKMPKERSIDIDTIDDFEYAEYLMLKNS